MSADQPTPSCECEDTLVMTEVGGSLARRKGAAEEAGPGGHVVGPRHRCSRLPTEAAGRWGSVRQRLPRAPPPAPPVWGEGWETGASHTSHFAYLDTTVRAKCTAGLPAGLLDEASEGRRAHLDERCRPIIKPHYCFLLPCKSSGAGFSMPVCFWLRRFIQINSEEKSGLPNHSDPRESPLHQVGDPDE